MGDGAGAGQLTLHVPRGVHVKAACAVHAGIAVAPGTRVTALAPPACAGAAAKQ